MSPALIALHLNPTLNLEKSSMRSFTVVDEWMADLWHNIEAILFCVTNAKKQECQAIQAYSVENLGESFRAF